MKRGLETDDGGLQLRYCIFDWDDNVVHMPTRIWMEDVKDGTSVPLSTAEFAIRRNDPDIRPASDAFREFRDNAGDFQGDIRRAMSGANWKAPAFNAFKEAVMEGRLFAIVTARGHSESIMQHAISEFIKTILSTDEWDTMLQSLREFQIKASGEVSTDLFGDYLNLCHFVGVSNPSFQQSSGGLSVEEGKKYAIRRFVKRTLEMSEEVFVQKGKTIAGISFGMSDDDHKNVEAVDALMRDELSPLYARVKFVVFNTGGGRVKRLKPHISDPPDPPASR